MLDALIRFSLRQRLLVIALALLLLGVGSWQAMTRPIDVFPDLNRPRVVVMTETPGLAPEEVETLVTLPIETALNGASGVQAVRSDSSVGISIVYVEFDWETNIYTARQIVAERLQTVQDRLPRGTQPQLAPISSIMGQVLILGMWSEGSVTDPMRLRTEADWLVRPRLLTIPGVAQVFTMGGERKQFQVLVDPHALVRYGVTLEQVEQAVVESNQNGTGGYLSRQGPHELLVRALGRLQSLEDLERVVVTIREGRPVALRQIARVIEGAQVRRGDGAAFVRSGAPGEEQGWTGGPAVVLTINKQPGVDTRSVTEAVLRAVDDLRATLPGDVRIVPLYSQASFIDRAVANVVEALRDGALLVVVVLFLFLVNLRTTFITLTAIPLSLMMTAIVFALWGQSINTMTLGGLAVAIGELVDDAIVDVENIFRRLRENRWSGRPRSPLRVVYEASLEIRSSIVFGTMIVILVFVPLFALSGMEGRLFTPLGIAYIVSILSSLLVSLTVTPVLSYWLLGRGGDPSAAAANPGAPPREARGDGLLLRGLKWVAAQVIRFSLRFPGLNIGVSVALVGLAGVVAVRLERDFLPPFNEGAVQLNVLLRPGVSLNTTTEINRIVEERLKRLEDVVRFVRRTGRAELDEHAEGVNVSEYILELDPDSPRSREEQLEAIRHAVADVPGIITATEQPLAHLISHMLSGVKAQIAVKVYGDDLERLRQAARELEAAIQDVRGVTDLFVEQQVAIPQLRIELDREKLLLYGLSAARVNNMIQTAMNGDVVSEVLVGQRSFDLVVRLADEYREDLATLERLTLELPDGGQVPLSAVARIREASGPNTIKRENVRRRIVLQCNVSERGVVDVVTEMQRRLQPIVAALPSGYFVEYGGQFESQQSASRWLGTLSVVSLLGVFLVLYALFRSVNLSLQVMSAMPLAFIGAVTALVVTGQTLTIASLVGFISLAGIASRNGILLLNHYLHLVRYEGETFTPSMIVRAGLERLAPVLMTALTSGIGLLPLVLAGDQPGREILYPVATVILGGLVSSTLLDFCVHPALFWVFGIRAAQRVVAEERQEAWEDSPREVRPPAAELA